MLPPEPVTDAHLHLWDPARLRYEWLDGLPELARPHTLPEYAAASAGPLAIARRVFVQCECLPAQARAEVEWVEAMAGVDAIVAYAPLETGARAEPDLRWLASRSKVRGVRRNLQGESEPEFCLRPDFVAGVRALARHGFTFDLCLRPAQLPAATELARRCPEVTFILDHLAKPEIAARRLDPWRADLRAFAALPNVAAKVSGLLTEADPAARTHADLLPYLEQAVACFGWDRLLFGGDWPVVNLAGDFRRWADLALEFAAAAAPAQRRAFFRDNAARIYRLSP